MANLGPRTMMWIVMDDQSPDTFSAYVNTYILLTPAEMAAIGPGVGTIDMTLEGQGVSIPGIKREANGRTEWLLRPPVDPLLAMFNALPGPGGWHDDGARDVWAGTAQYLLGEGTPPELVLTGFPALFNAAKAEVLAQLPPNIRTLLGL